MTFPLILDSLHEGIPAILDDAKGFYIGNCIVCLANQGHQDNTVLSIDYDGSFHTAEIVWGMEFNETIRMAYADLKDATEYGAVTIAVLLVRELTDYTTVERAVIGTTIDYFLSRKTDDPTLIFNRSARLEVSGILQESESNTIERRIREKIDRLIPDENLPTLIIVVEFSAPQSRIVKA